MWPAIGTFLQIVLLFLKNKFEKDEEERKRKDDLYAAFKVAVASRDVSGIDSLLRQLRDKQA